MVKNLRMHFLLRPILMGCSLLLSGCQLAVLQPMGSIAAQEKNLIIFATLLMLVIVIPVIILTVVFAWRYRASSTTAKYTPEWTDSHRLEAIFWALPCVIIAILATKTWISSHQLDPYRLISSKTRPLIIEAVALNWKWLFIYPEQHIATVNYLELPVGRPVEFMITADAPMNSLEIPQLAGQIYAMGGMRTRLNLIADHTGQFHGLSTSFSGDGFSDMDFAVKVTSSEQFTQWAQHIQYSTEALTWNTYQRLEKPSEHNAPEYLTTLASNDMFKDIVALYSKPSTNSIENTEFAGRKEKPLTTQTRG